METQLTEVMIKQRIKEIIFETTNIKPETINDGDAFVADLGLDSLTLMEIGVDIDQEYGLDMSDDDMKGLTSVQASAELVLAALSVTA